MTTIHHLVAHADCNEYCNAVHMDEGPDPFQPFRAMALMDHILHPQVWVTAKGEVIPFEQMSDQHLANTIRFLRRTARAQVNKFRWAGLRVPFPMFNGDMAQYHAEREHEEIVERMFSASSIGDIPAFRALVREHTKRVCRQRRQHYGFSDNPADWPDYGPQFGEEDDG